MTFESIGYKHWDTKKDSVGTTTLSYQRRIDSDEGFSLPLCACNDKVLINIRSFEFNVQGLKRNSCDIGLIHENECGEWCNLEIYSLEEKDLLENIEKYEYKLLAMWEAFNK